MKENKRPNDRFGLKYARAKTSTDHNDKRYEIRNNSSRRRIKARHRRNRYAETTRGGGRRIPLRFVVKSTPSSMHSLYEISRYLEGAPYCLTTVDTIFREKEFSNYIMALNDAMETYSADGLMAVTDYIDDEKPLYVDTDGTMTITGFLDHSDSCRYISGGIYGLSPKSIATLHACIERGESRMRNFQRAMVADGLHLEAFPFSKILDIDHKSDIGKAEEFLRV